MHVKKIFCTFAPTSKISASDKRVKENTRTPYYTGGYSLLILIFVQNIDVINFENKLLDFKSRFGKDYRLASDEFREAISEIDSTINHLQKVRAVLVGSVNHLRLANDKAEKLTVRSLTYKNSTMVEKFKEARDANKLSNVETEEVDD